MQTRRGLFGLIAGAAAAPFVPAVKPGVITFKDSDLIWDTPMPDLLTPDDGMIDFAFSEMRKYVLEFNSNRRSEST